MTKGENKLSSVGVVGAVALETGGNGAHIVGSVLRGPISGGTRAVDCVLGVVVGIHDESVGGRIGGIRGRIATVTVTGTVPAASVVDSTVAIVQAVSLGSLGGAVIVSTPFVVGSGVDAIAASGVSIGGAVAGVIVGCSRGIGSGGIVGRPRAAVVASDFIAG